MGTASRTSVHIPQCTTYLMTDDTFSAKAECADKEIWKSKRETDDTYVNHPFTETPQ